MSRFIALFLTAALLSSAGVTDRPTATPSEALESRGLPAQAAPSNAGTPGDALFGKADFKGAESAYALTLRSDPHNADAERGLARIALYRNDLDAAERYGGAYATDAPTDERANALRRTITQRRDDGPDDRSAIVGAEVVLPFERIDPLPELEALVDGKRAKVLIDTGGAGLDLAPAFVKALGVATEPAGEAVFAGGLRSSIRIGHVDRLDLGGASIRSVPIHVPPEMPPGIDGVIGTGVLYRFLSTIDYANRRLVLRPKSASKAFEAEASAREDAVIVPMLLVPDHFIFAWARIDKAPSALFNVDTGGPGIGVDVTQAELVAAAIVPDASQPGFLRGGAGLTRTLPFMADVTLGHRTFRQVPGVYLPDGDRTRIFPFQVAGTISHELFKRGALTFDFAAMKMIFDVPPQPHAIAPASFGVVGY